MRIHDLQTQPKNKNFKTNSKQTRVLIIFDCENVYEFFHAVGGMVVLWRWCKDCDEHEIY